MKKKVFGTAPLVIVITLILNTGYLFGDNLSLWGVVESMDLKAGSIVIDVKSGSCPGVRTFKFDPGESGLKGDITGKRVRFIIDSPICKEDETYTISNIMLSIYDRR